VAAQAPITVTMPTLNLNSAMNIAAPIKAENHLKQMVPEGLFFDQPRKSVID